MKKFYILIFIIGIFGFFFIKQFLDTKTRIQTSYHFVIEDIDTTTKGQLKFYYNNNWIIFSSYWISETDSILIGDSIAKDSCDKFLKIYRLDSIGRYRIISNQESIMWINRDMFCD